MKYTEIKTAGSIRFRIIQLTLLTVALLVLGRAPVHAAQTGYGYVSAKTLANGTLVSLTSVNGEEIEPTNQDNARRIIGVVNGITALQVGSHSSNTTVVRDGETEVLVNTLGGDIIAGDRLIISTVSGMAEKAPKDGNYQVIGTASADFSKSSPNAQVQQPTNSTATTEVGKIVANINIRQENNSAPLSLKNVGERLLGRPISSLRFLSAILILFGSILTAGMLLNSGIKTSLISLGRNPLVSGLVYRNLFKFTGISLLILGGGATACFLILRL